ncbi:MAG: hypothetical protein MUF71_01970 [Candidatus Kapabacteria bacterium]|jgi:hypothetical protein|nr:hypothetical protein [Candidatus Kapabacteria bacterium]
MATAAQEKTRSLVRTTTSRAKKQSNVSLDSEEKSLQDKWDDQLQAPTSKLLLAEMAAKAIAEHMKDEVSREYR